MWAERDGNLTIAAAENSSATLDAGHRGLEAMIAALDWRETPLGPRADWPQSLRTVVDVMVNSRFAMWMSWGPEHTFLYNDAYAPTLAEKHRWALGRPSREVWAEIWTEIWPLIETVLTTGRATWDEALFLFLERRGFREETYHTFSYSPIRDDAGVIAGHLCVVSEDTERVVNERRLATLRELAAGLAGLTDERSVLASVEASLGGNGHDLPFSLVYLVDTDIGISSGEMSPAASLAAATGFAGRRPVADAGIWPIAELRAGARIVEIDDLASVLPNAPTGAWQVPPRQALALAIGGTGEAGFLVAGVNPHRLPDPAYRDFLGLVAGQIGSAITGARTHEKERRRAEALAEIDRAKTNFFSNVSHEFRTPLTLMLGPLSEAIERADSASGSEVKPLIEVANRNAVRLLRLVNSLLDFSRIEANRVEARFVAIDLARFTAEIASSFRSAMDQAGLAYAIDCEPLAVSVHVDPVMWEKILLNLLSNAFKFTLAGGVTVSLAIDREAATSGPGRVILTVADTGTGIPLADQARVFERFHRVEGARGRSFEGSGIGLALVHDLVAMHGGTIDVQSEPGKGSRFRVAIPLGVAHLPAERIVDLRAGGQAVPGALGASFLEEAMSWLDAPLSTRGDQPLDHAEAFADAGPAQPTGQSASRPTRVLLVDDNSDMRHYVQRLLHGAGHEVISVGDGLDALDELAGARFDLVLSDVMMPRLDGLGLLRAIRSDPTLMDLPVILLSARAGEQSRLEGLEGHADDYLVKPFSARELLARVSAHIGVAQLRRDALAQARALADRLSISETGLRDLNETLEARIVERTAERDRLWDLSEDLLGIADYSGRLSRVSPSWTRVLGYSEADLLAADYRTLAHADDRARVVSAVWHARRTGTPVRFDARLRRQDGTYRWVSWAIMPDAVQGDTLFGVGRDITAEHDARVAMLAQIEERERVEATLSQMQRLEAVGQLTSGVAHDFNNLLTIVLGSIEYVERHVDNPKVRRRLEMMQSAARRGADVTAQLLAFSRKQHLDPRALDLNETVRGMNELLRTTLGGKMPLVLQLEPDLWSALADRTQLELVILNLAINARDAMPMGGRLTIATANARLSSPTTPEEPIAGHYVMIGVIDEGTGIQADVLARVFEPFFTTKEPGRGSGLGLAQVYGFAKQSGGGVRIETNEGSGTAVRVYLPRVLDAVSLDDDRAPRIGARPVLSGPARVLLVDDDHHVRETTRLMLEDLGYVVVDVDGGEAALAMLGADAGIDAVVTDFAMPAMSGAELATEIARRLPGMPVVMVTGYTDSRILRDQVRQPIVFKPFTRDQIADALAGAMDA